MVPYSVKATLMCWKTISRDYGHMKSARTRSVIDAQANPVPWFTYPAIEYLKQLDLSNRNVFEFGSGFSTLFWGKHCASVVSVEDHQKWYERIRKMAPHNAECLFRPDRRAYSEAIQERNTTFDIIVIDGSHRHECAVLAKERLAANGFFILDNSDWFARTAKFLREPNLIQVDMAGLTPVNGYSSTTSFFLTRSVDLKPINDDQPGYSPGSVRHTETNFDA
jgi:hypothetical protein